MAELVNQAETIIKQPHYQKDASTGELETPSADVSQTTDVNESQGMN